MITLRLKNVRWLILVLLLAFVVTSCKTTGARKHWWELWKPKKPTTASIYPEEQALPPPPSAEKAEQTGKIEPLPIVAETPEAPREPGDLSIPTPIREEPRGMVSELKTVHFAFDSSELGPEALAILDQNAEWLKAHPNVEVMIEGHCDERGTIEYNLNLGQRRADSVREHLVNQGVNPERLHTISYGKERPINPEHNEEAWSENRRAQFLIY